MFLLLNLLSEFIRNHSNFQNSSYMNREVRYDERLIVLGSLSTEYAIPGRKINSYIDYVDNNWRT